MTTQLQNRLIGTLVLAAVGIIFLPSILDGEKVSHKDTFVTMPEAPQVVAAQPRATVTKDEIVEQLPKEVPLSDEPALDDQLNQQTASTQSSDDTPEKTVEQVKPKPQMTDEVAVDDPKGSAWVVQLGSFRHSKNVDLLLRKLRSQGYVAFTRPIETTRGPLIKVFVGPDLSREKLEAQLPKLKKLTNLNGKVTSFMMDQ